MRIRTKLTLWYSGLLTVIIVIFSIAVIMVSRVTITNTVDRWLANLAESVADEIEVGTDRHGNPSSDGGIAFHSDNILHTPGVSFQVWHIADVVTGEHHKPVPLYDSDIVLSASAPLHADGMVIERPVYGNITLNSIPERVVAWPVYTHHDVLFGIVQVSTPIQFLDSSNEQLIFVTLISALICILVSLRVGSWLADHMLKPVTVITDTAASIVDAEDLSTRLDWQGPNDELGELTTVFNNMLGRLDTLFKVQQRFIRDVSHELRTPLTSILGNLELMQLYGIEKTSIISIQRDAERLHKMVNDLLMLTRADYGEVALDFHTVDLDSIALHVYENMLERTQDRNLSIVMERVEPVEIVASGEHIRHALTNLLHNAIKFTDDGGKITLVVYSENDEAIIEVRDTGIGIASEEQGHIFDRFYQADSSRMHRDDSDGAGLGLSIVQWIVEAHQGKIEVESTLGEGTLIRMRLPLQINPDKESHYPSVSTDLATLKVKRH